MLAQGHTDWDRKSCGDDNVHVTLHLLPGLDVADVTAKVAGVGFGSVCMWFWLQAYRTNQSLSDIVCCCNLGK